MVAITRSRVAGVLAIIAFGLTDCVQGALLSNHSDDPASPFLLPKDSSFLKATSPPVRARSRSADAWKTWSSHFSEDRSDTLTALSVGLKKLHPGLHFTVTRSRQFNLFAYASDPANEVDLRLRPGNEALAETVFVPTGKKSTGWGVLASNVVFGAFDVSYQGHELIAYQAQYTEDLRNYQAWFLFESGGTQVSDLLILSTGIWNLAPQREILIFDTPGFWRKDHDLWESIQKADWDAVILNETTKAEIRKDVAGFFKKESIYKDLGVPWKRGIIFLGPPGNGKTISLKALMKEVKEPTLYVKTFAQYGDDKQGIKAIFEEARAYAPCLMIIEDLDSLVTEQNRSFFLNEIDGLEDNNGILILGTTNHFDRLDGAVSNRPSRFDRKYVFSLPTHAEREQYALFWRRRLSGRSDIDFSDSLVTDIADKTGGFSFAYLQEAFVSALLLIAAEEDTAPFADVLATQIAALRKQLTPEDLENAPAARGHASAWTAPDFVVQSVPGGTI